MVLDVPCPSFSLGPFLGAYRVVYLFIAFSLKKQTKLPHNLHELLALQNLDKCEREAEGNPSIPMGWQEQQAWEGLWLLSSSEKQGHRRRPGQQREALWARGGCRQIKSTRGRRWVARGLDPSKNGLCAFSVWTGRRETGVGAGEPCRGGARI